MRSEGRVEFLLDVLLGAFGGVALDGDIGVKKGLLECELLLSGFSEPVLVLDVDDPVVIGGPDDDSHADPGHKLDIKSSHGIRGYIAVEILTAKLINCVQKPEKDIYQESREWFEPTSDS